jgi:RNA polymerase sigma factor (sigma-70 family)
MTQAPIPRTNPFCRHRQCEGLADRCLVADLAWSERSRLLGVARHRVGSSAEAEDVVSEALTRALESPDVDPARIGAWLTTVTIRLCVDHARENARAPKRWLYAVRTYPRADEFEADVVDTLSAAVIAPLLDKMPGQQRRALQLRADGEPVAAIALAMSLSEKAVESLLGRARISARTIVSGLGAAVAVSVGWLRRPDTAPASLGMSTAVAFAMTAVASANVGSPGLPAGGHAGVVVHSVHADVEPAAPRVRAAFANARIGTRLTVASAPRPSSGGELLSGKRRDVNVAGVAIHDGGSGRANPEESLQDSIRACVDSGIVVSTTYIGCRSARSVPR